MKYHPPGQPFTLENDMNCDLCKHCANNFEPLISRIHIGTIRDILFGCSSQTVWIVWRGERYPVRSFSKVNYDWTLWAETRVGHPMTLSRMHKELRNRENWSGLHNYSCQTHIEGPDVWAWIYRIEDTRTMPNLEDDGEAEDITGEVLIYVHTKEDVQLAWEASK
jgi:hypothetical protein